MSNYTKEDAIRFFKLGCDDYFNSLSHNCMPHFTFMFDEITDIDITFKEGKINGLARLGLGIIIEPRLTMFYSGESFSANNIIPLTKKEYMELKRYYFRMKPEDKKQEDKDKKKSGLIKFTSNLLMTTIVSLVIFSLCIFIFYKPSTKTYNGIVKSKYIGKAYRGADSYRVVFYCESLKKYLDVSVTPNEYANIDTTNHNNIIWRTLN